MPALIAGQPDFRLRDRKAIVPGEFQTRGSSIGTHLLRGIAARLARLPQHRNEQFVIFGSRRHEKRTRGLIPQVLLEIVPEEGLEPTRPYRALDFESSASAIPPLWPVVPANK
jgi:hypothetical protein